MRQVYRNHLKNILETSGSKWLFFLAYVFLLVDAGNEILPTLYIQKKGESIQLKINPTLTPPNWK